MGFEDSDQSESETDSRSDSSSVEFSICVSPRILYIQMEFCEKKTLR